MTSLVQQNWLYILVPIAVTILGSIVATIGIIAPQLRSVLQHFTAGVVFAAVAGEVLPDLLHRDAPIQVIIGFVLGVIAMFGVQRLTEQGRSPNSDTLALPMGLIAAVGVDALLDGLVIGIGFTAGTAVGILVTIALSLEMFFLGVTTAASLAATGAGRGRVIAIVTGLALIIGVGAILGLTILSGLSSNTLGGVLAFGCAALLYLVTEELLVEAHSVTETPLMSSAFFVGFLVLLVIEMLI